MSTSVLFYSVLWKRAIPGQYQSPAILVSIALLLSVLPPRILEWLAGTGVSSVQPAGDPVTGDDADPVDACSDFRCTAAIFRLGLPCGSRGTRQTMNF